MIMQTITGAMMLQVQSMLAGQDPRDLIDWKVWAASALKGGTLGIYGDFLYSQSATRASAPGHWKCWLDPRQARAPQHSRRW